MTDDDWARLRAKLIRLASARFGPDKAEDIVHDALVRFFDSGALREPDALESYLCRTVINVGIARWRHETRLGRIIVNPIGDLNGLPAACLDLETTAELADVEAQIGPELARLLADYVDDGGKRTAERLGINYDYLRVLIHETRRFIRGEALTPKAGASRVRRLRQLAEAVA